MSSKAYRIPGAQDRLRKHSLNLKQLEALIRLRDTARPVLPTKSSGGSPAGATGGGTGNFLPTAGGVMIGNIAFDPKLIAVSDGRVDLDPGGNPPENSSYILVTGQGTPDDIRFIDGAERNGQYLIYQGTNQQVQNLLNANLLSLTNIVGDSSTTVTVLLSDTGTLSNGDTVNITGSDNYNENDVTVANLVADTSFTYESSNGANTTPDTGGVIQDGNITTADGNTLVLDGTLSTLNVPIVILIFDVTAPGGVWRVVSSGESGGTATNASVAIFALTSTQTSGVVNFDSNTISGTGIVDQGGGVFQLSGNIFQLNSSVLILGTDDSMRAQWQTATDAAFTTPVDVGRISLSITLNTTTDDNLSNAPITSAFVDATSANVYVRLLTTDSVGTGTIQTLGTWGQIFSVGGGNGGGDLSFPITPPVLDLGTVTTNQNIDLSLSTGHSTEFVIGADIDVTFSGYPSSGNQEEWEVQVTQDGVGGWVITWPSEVVNPPVISTLADATTIVIFRTNDGGTTVRVGNTVTTSIGQSQTPWLQNIDSDGFNLVDLSNIEFRQTTGAPNITDPAIWFDTITENAMVFNVTSANGYNFKINGTETLQVLSNGDLQINGKDIFGIVNLSFEESGIDIESSLSGLTYQVPTGDIHAFEVNTVNVLNILDGELQAITANVDGPTLRLRNDDQTPTNNDTAATILFTSNTDTLVESTYGSIDVQVDNISNTGKQADMVFRAQESNTLKVIMNFLGNLDKMNMFQELDMNANKITDITDPTLAQDAATKNYVDNIVGGANTTLSNLTSPTAINQNLNLDLNLITFSSATSSISATSSSMFFDVPAADQFTFRINNVETLQVLSNGDLQINGKDIFGIVNLSFEESGIDINSSTSGLEYNVPTSDTHTFEINNTDVLQISSSLVTIGASISDVDFQGADLINLDDISFSQANTSINVGADIVTHDYPSGGTWRVREGSTSRIIIDSGFRITNSTNIGVFGNAAVAQQSVASDTLANLYTALRNYGWIA